MTIRSNLLPCALAADATRHRARARVLGALLAVAFGAGCTAVGPDYRRPSAPFTEQSREHWRQAGTPDTDPATQWKPATPQDLADGDRWWARFDDANLDTLIDAIDPSNQNLRAAEARYRQALAVIAQARAGLFPTVSADLQGTRSLSPVSTGTRGGVVTSNSAAPSTVYDVGLTASWEIDLWGRVSRTLESNRASAVASAADLAAVRLSARATLAQSYFQLRVAERRERLLADTVAANRRALTIAENRYAAGVVPRADVIQAQSQLASVEAQLIDVRIPLAQLEHAIALLVGRAPADFTLKGGELPALPQDIPLALPSTLLERRPDIAAAERRMAAANAQIGVATAAYFPALTLSGASGFRSTDLSNWITAPARYWSLGPALVLTLFDAGRRRGVIDQNEALYDERVAQYRQTVLTALQEVEDNLVALRVLDAEAAAQQRAVEFARQTLEVTLNQYRAGLVGFTNVVTAQTALLSAEQTALSVLGRQFDASVILVRALGGGWSTTELPAPYRGAGRVDPERGIRE
ncbi:MAG: efflux transporter outer membrane subunit [Proteobacteria bacterium]|nr:efflux transporter outer membrane subunit [Burkholderiales bacterium]